MSTELFFIYDTHCPWSYATTALVKEIAKTYPNINMNLWHCAHYEVDETVSRKTIDAVEDDAEIEFTNEYVKTINVEKDSTLSANLLGWVSQKVPHLTLELLQAIQKQHFEQGTAFTHASDFQKIIEELKLSPPAKVFKEGKFAKEAEFILQEISEFQDIIGTKAIPALLIAHNENLTLLNHNLYLQNPSAIIEAIDLEMMKD
jgi:protein-disulfide isomerase-like protein with CxxC motif